MPCRRRRRGEPGRSGRDVPVAIRRQRHDPRARRLARQEHVAYLIDQIEQTPNIAVLPHAEVVAAERRGAARVGHGARQGRTGGGATIPADAMFVFIGAVPGSDVVRDLVELDDHGFVLTGLDLMRDGQRPRGWTPRRDPFIRWRRACPASSRPATCGRIRGGGGEGGRRTESGRGGGRGMERVQKGGTGGRSSRGGKERGVKHGRVGSEVVAVVAGCEAEGGPGVWERGGGSPGGSPGGRGGSARRRAPRRGRRSAARGDRGGGRRGPLAVAGGARRGRADARRRDRLRRGGAAACPAASCGRCRPRSTSTWPSRARHPARRPPSRAKARGAASKRRADGAADADADAAAERGADADRRGGGRPRGAGARRGRTSHARRGSRAAPGGDLSPGGPPGRSATSSSAASTSCATTSRRPTRRRGPRGASTSHADASDRAIGRGGTRRPSRDRLGLTRRGAPRHPGPSAPPAKWAPDCRSGRKGRRGSA